MPKQEDIRHSILIVSGSEQFEATVRRALKGFLMVDTRKSAAMARRSVLEHYYDMIVINAPLPDETGEQFARDLTEQCRASVLLVVPLEVCQDAQSRMADDGILVIPKPLSREQLDTAIRFLTSIQNRIRRLEMQITATEEKMEEMRIVNKAKFYLGEKQHMTEDDAHRLIGKQAMDHGISRRRMAEMILEDW